MRDQSEVVYITYDEALDLVDRIADRTERFNHTMSKNEKEVMTNLLSNIGVRVADLIDVSYLADNYAINAEIVTPDNVDSYDRRSLKDALFSWEEDGETFYCLSW